MFVGEERCDPDDGPSTKDGGVGDRLPEMVMVGLVELILDDDVIASGVAGEDVG